MTKEEVRKEMRIRKQLITETERAKQSELICKQLLNHPRWLAAKTILLYCSLPDEVDTTPLFQAIANSASETKKQIVLPVVVGEELELRYHQGTMHKGAYGILEPKEGTLLTSYGDIDLVVVPGMAFDKAGHRIGRGKGYYDRLFARMSEGNESRAHYYKIGVGFDFQCLDEVPHEAHDTPVDELICGA